ncbi:hydroxyisourate hydrolase [Hoeflea sp. TYP-13]|uniref:hydroxyisourate hydrolase n=1 Tax=Hoeflea sp. TYP-13 TaxID=3230023 RepID=UPI0034C63499
MATVSSHILNGVDGTHAGGIAVSLSRIGTQGSTLIFATRTDDGGRLLEEVDLTGADIDATYEAIFATGAYWANRSIPSSESQIMQEIVLRFQMPDPGKKYHMPIILSPNSYSAWLSG